MRRLVPLLAAAFLVAGAASCTSSSDSGSDTTTTTTAASGGTATTTAGTGDTAAPPDTSDLPSFDTVQDIGDALDCQLDYDGIADADRTYSTCVFNDEQAFIYVYNDASVAADVAATGDTGLVVGANWTVQVETDENAQAVADATGGQVASTGAGATTTTAPA